jgi:hypothetical protein
MIVIHLGGYATLTTSWRDETYFRLEFNSYRLCEIQYINVGYLTILTIIGNNFAILILTFSLRKMELMYPNVSLNRFCGLIVRGPGYRARGPGLIPCAIIFSEK